MANGGEHSSWIDGLVAVASGVVLWVLGWIREGIRDNRNTQDQIKRQIAKIKAHMGIKDDED